MEWKEGREMFQSASNKESWGMEQSESTISIIRPRQVYKLRCWQARTENIGAPSTGPPAPKFLAKLRFSHTHHAHSHHACTKLELNFPLPLSLSSIYHTRAQSFDMHPGARRGQRSILGTSPQDPCEHTGDRSLLPGPRPLRLRWAA